MVMTDWGKFDRPGQLHIAFQALHEYNKQKESLPKPRCQVQIRMRNGSTLIGMLKSVSV